MSNLHKEHASFFATVSSPPIQTETEPPTRTSNSIRFFCRRPFIAPLLRTKEKLTEVDGILQLQ